MFFFFIWDGNVYVFYKLVKEWLIDKLWYGSYEFIMLEKDGYRIVGKICVIEFDKLRVNNVYDVLFSDI